jgi:PhnB protein
MAKLNAYLMFNGNCKEGMDFYKGCLGGKLNVMTYGDAPAGTPIPAGSKGKVMHAKLESGGISVMASDDVDAAVKPGNSVYLCLIGERKGEIDELFKKLSAGGKVVRPLKEEFFGTYGQLTDKFGFNWMFQYGTGQTR